MKYMDNKIEAGKIINTHGIAGDVKIEVWLDSAEMLKKIKKLSINNNDYRVIKSSISKNFLIAHLENINNIDEAILLKNKTVFVYRNDIKLPKGRFFICDIIGFNCYDTLNNEIGILTDVIENPAQLIYVVKGDSEHLIPAVPEFIDNIDFESKKIIFKLIEGL